VITGRLTFFTLRARTRAKSPECGDTQHGAKTESLTKIQQGSIWALRFYCNLPLPAGLSVTTFCSFQREFSPLGVCGGENGNVRLIRFRLSGGCCRSLPGIWTRFLHRRVDFLGIVDHSQSAASAQLAIDISGSHVRHEVFRLNSIRD